MRRIVVALMGTLSGLIMLFSYHTSLSGGTALAVPASTGVSSSMGTASAAKTVTGDTAQTQWGPVQIQITVSAAGTITGVTAVQYPNGNGRDQEINAYALPVLGREVLSAQSAQIDHVSGATVTSDGYVASLQSALDKANL